MSVRPSVWLSVTRSHCVKMTYDTIMRCSLEDIAPRLYSFLAVTSSRIYKRNIRTGNAKWEWGQKNFQFSTSKSPYLRNSTRYHQGYYEWLIGRNICAFNQSINQSITFNVQDTKIIDLGWPWTAVTHSIAEMMHFVGAHHKRLNENRPILSTANVYCRQTGVGRGGWISTNFRCYIFERFRNKVVIIVHYDNTQFWISADTNIPLNAHFNLKCDFRTAHLTYVVGLCSMLWLSLLLISTFIKSTYRKHTAAAEKHKNTTEYK